MALIVMIPNADIAYEAVCIICFSVYNHTIYLHRKSLEDNQKH